MREEVLLFVKEPVPGRVKTRLAAGVGTGRAARLYRAFARDMLDAFLEAGLTVRVCFTPEGAEGAVRDWLPGASGYLPQKGPDLGARMEAAFFSAFAAGVERAVLVGSDLPDLPAGVVAGALRELERFEAVLGPADDGGYYLVGFRREALRPEVFRAMTWSGADVFDRTEKRLRGLGCTVGFAPAWRDVDIGEDLEALALRLYSGESAAPRTRALLADMKKGPGGP